VDPPLSTAEIDAKSSDDSLALTAWPHRGSAAVIEVGLFGCLSDKNISLYYCVVVGGLCVQEE